LRIHERANKLSPFWKGPYRIIRKVNNVNYEVDLPKDNNMSRIIHVQHIKPWYGELPGKGRPILPVKDKLERISHRDRTQEQIVHRPITRAYQKILDCLEQQKKQSRPVAEGK
jgi:hypothetical protein